MAQSGGQLFVVSLTNAIQIHPSEESRKQFAMLLQINDVLYPDQRITAHCRQNGIAVLSLVPGMQAHAQKHNRFLHGFENTTLGQGHWNAAGHLVAGSLIVDWLEQELAGAASEIQPVSHEE